MSTFGFLPGLLGKEAAAFYLGQISTWSLDKLVREGKIIAQQHAGGQTVFFTPEELDRYIKTVPEKA